MKSRVQKMKSFGKSPRRKFNHRPQLESLEARQLLTGSVTTEVSRQTLYIVGDAEDNQIELFQQQNGAIRIQATDSLTSICGTTGCRDAQIVPDVIRNIRISMHAGNDNVVVRDLNVGNDLRAEMGSGGDSLKVTNVTTGDDIYVWTGGGGTSKNPDLVTVSDVQVGGPKVNNDLGVFGTEGFEQLGLARVTVEDDIWVRLTKQGEGDVTSIEDTTVKGDYFGGTARVDSHSVEARNLDVAGEGDFRTANQLSLDNSNFDELHVDGTAQSDSMTFSETTVATPTDVELLAGDDEVTVQGNQPYHISGGSGDDRLVGGAGNDRLIGDDGNDTLIGNSGDDVLHGEAGNDSIHGGNGNDALHGGDGDDHLRGNSHGDRLFGDAGEDELHGGLGNDVQMGGADNDTLYGGGGDDRLSGESGDDRLIGGSHNDTLYGGEGADVLFGESGEDGLFGGSGIDEITPGSGADRILSWAPDESFVDPDIWHSVDDVADANIRFRNTYETYFSRPPAEWTHQDIERVDEALKLLHHQGPGTKLIHHRKGGSPHLFNRYGGNRAGGTGSGAIYLTNGQFGASDTYLRTYVLHEVGHNWQQSWSAEAYAAIQQLVGWTIDPCQGAGDSCSPEDGHTKSSKGDWWYLTSEHSNFVSNYARSSLQEDFAETFAAYFAHKAGWGFYNSSNQSIDAFPERKAIFDDWFANL